MDAIEYIISGVAGLVVFAIGVPISTTALTAANFTGNLATLTAALPVILGLGVMVLFLVGLSRR